MLGVILLIWYLVGAELDFGIRSQKEDIFLPWGNVPVYGKKRVQKHVWNTLK